MNPFLTNITLVIAMAKANHHKTFEPTIANGTPRLRYARCCVFTKADNLTPDLFGSVEYAGSAILMCNVKIYPYRGGIRVAAPNYGIETFEGFVQT